MSREDERFDLIVRSSLESIMHVNAYPDSEYPIRILEAHLALNEGTWMEGFGGGEELAEVMNSAQEKRNLLLHNAIALLRSKPIRWSEPPPEPPPEPPMDSIKDDGSLREEIPSSQLAAHFPPGCPCGGTVAREWVEHHNPGCEF